MAEAAQRPGPRNDADSDVATSYFATLDVLFDAMHVASNARSIVEVGAGTGTLARWLAARAGPGAEVVGFDIDAASIERATVEAERHGVTNVRFLPGDVTSLSIPPGTVDVVVCRHLLCVLRKPDAAVSRMVSWLRTGGQFVAIEPATEQGVSDPADVAYDRLSRRLLHAFHVGWSRVGRDPAIGLRVPQLLIDAGLVDIRAEAAAQCHLLADGRRTLADIEQQLVTEVYALPESTRELLRRGGFSPTDQRERERAASARLTRFRASDGALARSGYLRLMSTQIVAVGTAPGASEGAV